MSSATITTIVTMLESLPDDLQECVAEHMRELIADLLIADLEDEARWDSFAMSHT